MKTLVMLFVLVGTARADDGWKIFKTTEGVRYDKREVAGSKYLEYRALFTLPVAPDALREAIWSKVIELHGPQVAARDVVKKSDDEIVIHDYIKTPVVSDRELTLRFTKTPVAIRYSARNDLGPPPKPGRVLLPVVNGGWRFDPIAGGTQITYDCYSEPGGSVPAWMVRGSQQDQIVDDVKRLKAILQR